MQTKKNEKKFGQHADSPKYFTQAGLEKYSKHGYNEVDIPNGSDITHKGYHDDANLATTYYDPPRKAEREVSEEAILQPYDAICLLYHFKFPGLYP